MKLERYERILQDERDQCATYHEKLLYNASFDENTSQMLLEYVRCAYNLGLENIYIQSHNDSVFHVLFASKDKWYQLVFSDAFNDFYSISCISEIGSPADSEGCKRWKFYNQWKILDGFLVGRDSDEGMMLGEIVESLKEVKEDTPVEKDIIFDRIWAMPNKNTFSIKPIEELIKTEKCGEEWADPFANDNKLAKYTNDLNPECSSEYHMDALDFLKTFRSDSLDGVLYDPPYSPRQLSECYKSVGISVTSEMTRASFWSDLKAEISRIVRVGGKVISFGWNSGGIGKKYGFEIEKILLVPHGGQHNDTICVVERKVR